MIHGPERGAELAWHAFIWVQRSTGFWRDPVLPLPPFRSKLNHFRDQELGPPSNIQREKASSADRAPFKKKIEVLELRILENTPKLTSEASLVGENDTKIVPRGSQRNFEIDCGDAGRVPKHPLGARRAPGAPIWEVF